MKGGGKGIGKAGGKGKGKSRRDDITCNNCGGIGHYQSECISRARWYSQGQQWGGQRRLQELGGEGPGNEGEEEQIGREETEQFTMDDYDEINFGELQWADGRNDDEDRGEAWPTITEANKGWKKSGCKERSRKDTRKNKERGVAEEAVEEKVRVLRGADATIYQPMSASLDILSIEGDDNAWQEDEHFLGELEKRPAAGGEWVKASAVADSGAEEHAMPENTLPFLKVTPSEASKAGRAFRGAGNERIPARGKQVTRGVTREGNHLITTWEVCPVKRPLLSLVKLAKAGNVVKIGGDDAQIFNFATRKVTRLRKHGNAFMLDFWVWRPHDTKSGTKPVFTRQGATP